MEERFKFIKVKGTRPAVKFNNSGRLLSSAFVVQLKHSVMTKTSTMEQHDLDFLPMESKKDKRRTGDYSVRN